MNESEDVIDDYPLRDNVSGLSFMRLRLGEGQTRGLARERRSQAGTQVFSTGQTVSH